MRITPRSRPPLELWGGVECTGARVGDGYLDQIRRSGHQGRLEDLDLIANLGLRAIRYPVLWERVAPHGLESADWSWTDERLGRLRELGIRPIVGLVHHGSGPRHTSLVDPSFAEGLAEFARAVAERYPWVDAYTPVNEPLTTARFSGLYGHWYPHGLGGSAHPDRRPRQDVQHPSARLSGGIRERAPLDHLRSAVRPGGPTSPLV